MIVSHIDHRPKLFQACCRFVIRRLKKLKQPCKTKETEKVEKAKDPDEAVVDVMAPKKDTRPAGVDGWKFRVSYIPESTTKCILVHLSCRLGMP